MCIICTHAAGINIEHFTSSQKAQVYERRRTTLQEKGGLHKTSLVFHTKHIHVQYIMFLYWMKYATPMYV